MRPRHNSHILVIRKRRTRPSSGRSNSGPNNSGPNSSGPNSSGPAINRRRRAGRHLAARES